MTVSRASIGLVPRGLTAALLLLLSGVGASPAVAQAGSPAGAVPVERLVARRDALLKRMGRGIAVLRSADERSIEGDYPQDSDYREDNDFFYLTGLEAPHAWLVLVARDTGAPEIALYIPPRDTSRERWTGAKLGVDEAIALSGIREVRADTAPEAAIRRLVWNTRVEALFYKREARAGRVPLFTDLTFGPSYRVEDLRPHLAALRLIKDADELTRLRKAIDISTEGHLASWRVARPGVLERELEAAAEGTFRRLGAERVGYPSIVGAGFNGTTLHYDKSRGRAEANDLVVMDMGAEYGYYSADVTRTIPVSGKFTPRQRAIYDLVLATQQAMIDSTKPGVTLAQLNGWSRAFMKAHSGDLCHPVTCDVYYIHGLGHWIGMDVHDVGGYATPLAPGMVFTIEPGIYLPAEKFGVRIEDDILVTASGREILSTGAPRKADEIERYLQQHRGSAAADAGSAGSRR